MEALALTLPIALYLMLHINYIHLHHKRVSDLWIKSFYILLAKASGQEAICRCNDVWILVMFG